MLNSSEYAQLSEDGKDDATLLGTSTKREERQQEGHGMLETIEIDAGYEDDHDGHDGDGLTVNQRSILQQRAQSKLQWRLRAAYFLFGGLVLFGFTVRCRGEGSGGGWGGGSAAR